MTTDPAFAPATSPPTPEKQEPFGLYIHWPFCLSKCPYCDFNSWPRLNVDHESWRKALAARLDFFAERTGPRTISSIFFGGGTPSLMEAKTLETLIDKAARRWALPSDAEISMEANPTSAEESRFRDYRTAGVNRLSLGVQALDDAALKKLGRTHSLSEALHALELARSVFPRMSFDLIYAREKQTPEEWRDELTFALTLAADHISLYQLTLSASCREIALPDADRAAELYLLTDAVCEQAGLPAYEVSNYARPGEECRGNLLYWEGGDYVGVGPGAHGRLNLPEAGGSWALVETPDPDLWLRRSINNDPEILEATPLSAKERAWELVIMGLRLVKGVDIDCFRPQCQGPLTKVMDKRAIERLIGEQFLERREKWLRTTLKGRLVLDAVVENILV
ncbi:coproporphyrinogen III oxidase [Alphaproteobacteria bacterium]|nr:coproporphyrinogen III oxidase [Alphaproteobacteria bacterium]